MTADEARRIPPYPKHVHFAEIEETLALYRIAAMQPGYTEKARLHAEAMEAVYTFAVHSEVARAVSDHTALTAEVESLRSKLATARADAMEEAAKIAERSRVETRDFIGCAIRSALPKQTMGGE